MNIIFRVDSSLKIGAGHLMRCLTLADEFKKRNHNITFICRSLNGNLISLIKYPVLTLPINSDFQSNDFYLNWLGATQEQDAKDTLDVIPSNTDLLVVDSYAIDKKWHKKLKSYTKKIMVIDDLADRILDCDILLNQNLGSKKIHYKAITPEHCQLLVGIEYALLRPEFQNLRSQALEKRIHTKTIKNILISMGGSDINNLTYKVLKEIDDSYNTTVVCGVSSPHNQKIQKYAKNKNVNVIIGSNNMAELMLNADLAIGTGGSTSWERCCLGLPALLFVAAYNQRKISVNLEKMNAVKIVNNLKKDLDLILNDFNLWKRMSNEAKNICDGQGVKKVVNLC